MICENGENHTVGKEGRNVFASTMRWQWIVLRAPHWLFMGEADMFRRSLGRFAVHAPDGSENRPCHFKGGRFGSSLYDGHPGV